MSTHKYIDKICCVAVVLALLITVLFANGEKLGVTAVSNEMGYESRLFDISTVHTIDIVMDDWDSFIETCENEEYISCNVVIDGEAYKNVAIRAKGNTSLSTVSQMNSDRYSFKLEFDQYDSTRSYYGLDKLSLNNIIQDNTYMKDFLVYQMMNQFGADAPLCSYVFITVNGEDWGLYLAVEGVEDAFLERNYGNDYGELYKPDSMSFGGGRGNGRDFNMEGFDPSGMFGGGGEMPPEAGADEESGGGDRSYSFGGMGSSDVKLQYIDDDPDSYSNIFDNAKTDITNADKQRLIESLQTLSSGKNIEDVVNIEEVIRYFVVHNFVVNDDSYTGSMVHNYYLYEEEGKLSMIPWDYNLAFGTFQSGNATSTVNDPIDSPVSGGSMGDRPMVAWIFENEEYTKLYHQYFSDFITDIFDSGKFTELVDSTAEMIAPYVEKDPSKFCTYEEFETGVKTIREFCLLRAESIKGQLDGTIPATQAGQFADDAALVDASSINISDMGTMNMGGGFDGRGNGDGTNNFWPAEYISGHTVPEAASGTMPGLPKDFDPSQMFPEGGEMPDMGSLPEMPGGMGGFGGNGEMPDMESLPNGMESDGENRDTADVPVMSENIFPGGINKGSVDIGSVVMILVISLVVLVGGLIVAFKFKR